MWFYHPNLAIMKTYLPKITLCIVALVASLGPNLYGETLFELEFPYATKWSGAPIQHFGSKVIDFDHDGVADDNVKLAAFSTPQSPEYKGTDFYTSPGPELVMRVALANLDAPNSADLKRIASPGLTPEAIRIEPDRKVPGLTSNSAFVAWWYLPSESFKNGGEPASFASGGSLFAESIINNYSIVWRAFVKNGSEYYVSKAFADRTRLRVPDLAGAQWYRYDGVGHDLRLKPDATTLISGSQLTNVQGVGIYAELIGFDDAKTEAKRTVLDVKTLKVELN